MFFERIYEKRSSSGKLYSWMRGKLKKAIVIDPKRDIDTYLEIAEREKPDNYAHC